MQWVKRERLYMLIYMLIVTLFFEESLTLSVYNEPLKTEYFLIQEKQLFFF